jgi:hypothetical protein
MVDQRELFGLFLCILPRTYSPSISDPKLEIGSEDKLTNEMTSYLPVLDSMTLFPFWDHYYQPLADSETPFIPDDYRSFSCSSFSSIK